MAQKYEIDNLDKQILSALLNNARCPFSELANNLMVSNGTIHVRVNKLKEAGIITGSRIDVDYTKLGYDVCCFIGINLKSAKDYSVVLENLRMFDEVVEVHYTTGGYSIFTKIMTKSIEQLHKFLVSKIQFMPEVHSTETLISLENPLNRNAVP